MRASHQAGVFRVERLRGRGCWPADDGIALHLGDRLLAPGARAYTNPDQYIDRHRRIYERLHRLEGPCDTRALPLAEAQGLLDLFTGALWHEEASGYLLAGWTVLAPLCGALPWRPHVYLVGDAGSGKTTILQQVLMPLMGGDTEHGGMCHYVEGGTTEAGIRHKMRSDGLPVVYDEAEKVDQRSDDRVQAVLSLMRSASSSGASVAKGSATGRGVTYAVRSMFCLASIGSSLRNEADKSRVALLQLKGGAAVEPEVRRSHWTGYRPKLGRITEQTGRELIARSLGWLRDGRLAKTIATFRSAAAVTLSDARAGDQYGTLYAGAWTLMADTPPTEQEARELLGGGDLSHYVHERQPAGRKLLDVLLQARERIELRAGPRTLTVGQLIEAALGRIVPGVEAGEADAVLRQYGLRIDTYLGADYVYVATKSEWVRRTLRDTAYGDDPEKVLRSLPGVGPGGKKRFAGYLSHTSMVPIAVIDDTSVS